MTTAQHKPHIVLVIARGEAVRNFLYSDTLRILSDNARVTLLSVIHDEDFQDRFGPLVEQIIPLEDYHESSLVQLFRKTLHYTHFRWLWSEAVKSYWGFRNNNTETLRSKLSWLWLRTSSKLLAHRRLLELLTRLERYLSWALRPTYDFEKLFAILKPDLIFNCSHIHGSLADLPMRVAHQMDIPTAVFVFSWDNLTSRSRIFVPYDYYLMWNEEMKGQLLSQYPNIDSARVIATGTPQFDYHFKPEYCLSREELCNRIGIDPERPFILYTTGQNEHFLEEHKILEEIINYVQEIDLNPKPQLVVRTYIKGTSSEMQSLLAKDNQDVVSPPVLWDKKWSMPLYEDLPIYTSLLHHTSLGINVASTVSLELMMIDKPVTNLGFEPPGSNFPDYWRLSRHVEYEHYKPVKESGGVMVARSMDDLRAMIYKGLTEPHAQRDARRRFTKWMFGDTLDGHSGVRVAETLLELAEKRL